MFIRVELIVKDPLQQVFTALIFDPAYGPTSPCQSSVGALGVESWIAVDGDGFDQMPVVY